MKRSESGLNAAHLRILAMVLMFLDHMNRTVTPGSGWISIAGRLAFPIFAFQCAEGYRRTRNFRRYCLRLMLFGLISEIPFDLMISGSAVYPWHQNVLFTLLLGLLACRAVDCRHHWVLLPILLAAEAARLDYGAMGVLTVLVFHIYRDEPLPQLTGLAAIHCLGFGFLSGQSFAVLAWLPIRAYNGEKGPGGKALQYAAYCFYPAHLLLLSLL